MGSTLKTFSHLIDEQFRAERGFCEEYQGGHYDLGNPFIVLNPYLIAPLTAVIMFKTNEKVAIEVTVKGKEKNSDFIFSYPEGTDHVLQVYGLYPEYENQIILKTSNGEISELSIKTEAVPSQIPTIRSLDVEQGLMDGQLIFVVPAAKCGLTAGYDVNGDCRWYTVAEFSYHFKRGNNGRILVGAPPLLAPPFSATTLYEMGLVGKIYAEYRLPYGYHHGYFEKKDNNLILLTQNIEMGTSGDLIALMDRESGEVLKQWDLKDFLPQDVAGSGSQDMHDWFHNNSVWYDEASNTLTLTGRHQDIILNIDYEDGSINWMMGDPEGWPDEYVNQYFLKPMGELEWPYEPYAVKFINNNQFICFDSGHYRSKNKENYLDPDQNYSRAVLYEIDPEELSVRQVWEYGKHAGKDFYSTYMGDIDVCGENHYRIHSGGNAKVNDKNVDMPGIFEKDINPQTVLRATTVEIKENREVLKLVMDINSYCAERISLQDSRDKLQFGIGNKIGEFAPTEEFALDMPTAEAGLIPDEYNLSFSCDGERLFLKADFMKAEMVLLHLVGEKDNHTFYIQSTRRPFYTMCFYTFCGGDKRPVEWPITVKQLKDCYKILLTINENTYETGLTIDLRK